MSLDDLNFCEKFNEKYRDKFLRIREVKADQSFQGNSKNEIITIYINKILDIISIIK